MMDQMVIDELCECVAEAYNRAIRNAERERNARMKVVHWIADQIRHQEDESAVTEPEP